MTVSHVVAFWIAVFIVAFFLELFLPPEVEAETVGAAAPAPRTSVPAPRSAVAGMAFAPRRKRHGAGALPSTIRQRIRTEAHGGLPAVQHQVLDLPYATPRMPRRVDEFELTA
ncbi:hypothetical protein J7E99_22215 [Streptomyces sp. ISL-44]|uniref:hypothetical protein n=1 Tax=Streptomyces sp. ISL-44 TaxID=2819184 RepID=UPI001BE799DA|nr:hypothetical protein [Streptomyces sp. ISL-44]MBT2543335.1 hypothetical protein [Streptomyces sp. ISL-44]